MSYQHRRLLYSPARSRPVNPITRRFDVVVHVFRRDCDGENVVYGCVRVLMSVCVCLLSAGDVMCWFTLQIVERAAALSRGTTGPAPVGGARAKCSPRIRSMRTRNCLRHGNICKTRSIIMFVISNKKLCYGKVDSRRPCLVDLLHCQHCFPPSS